MHVTTNFSILNKYSDQYESINTFDILSQTKCQEFGILILIKFKEGKTLLLISITINFAKY